MQSRWNAPYLWHLWLSISGNYLLNWLFILLKWLQHMQHWQIACSITPFKREARFQCTEMLNRECSCKQMSQHWWFHMYHTYSWIADGFTQEKNPSSSSSSSLPCQVPVSPPALPPHLLLPHLLTDPRPSADLLLFLVPFSWMHPLTSHHGYFMVGSVFRSESDTGNSWANLQ